MGCCQLQKNSEITTTEIETTKVKSRNKTTINYKNEGGLLNLNTANNTLFKEEDIYNTSNPEEIGAPLEIAKEMPIDSIYFKVKASSEEKMYPIWVEKGTVIQIRVSGKWNCLEDLEDFNCEGAKITIEEINDNFNLGALCGFILGGEAFSITENCSFTSQCSGPLILYQNNGNFLVSPIGFLHFFIHGAVHMSLIEIETKLGWEITLIDTCSDKTYMKEEEKKLIYILNKLRSNPQLFAKLYIENKKQQSDAYIETYEYLTNCEPREVFQTNEAIYKVAKNHAIDMGENKMTGHISSNGNDINTRFANEDLHPTTIPFGENCSYGLMDTMSIVIQLIVDEGHPNKGHRHNLMNKDYNFIGVSIQNHEEYGVNCVQNFAKF